MKFSDLMAHYDYKMINICRSLHVARDTVKSWRDRDCIPFKMQCVIEVMSDGKLKARKDKQ